MTTIKSDVFVANVNATYIINDIIRLAIVAKIRPTYNNDDGIRLEKKFFILY